MLRGGADLSSDQLYLACHYLQLSEAQSRYMALLLEHARSGLKKRREQLLGEIRAIQTSHLRTQEHIQAEPSRIGSLESATYYLDPFIQLVHVCLAIPRYQKDPNLLIDDLRTSTSRLAWAINQLEAMEFIARTKDGIRLKVESVHLPKDSALYRAWRNQLKLMAINRLDQANEEHTYSFAVLFSADDDTRRQIQSRFLSFLKDVEQLVKDSRQEAVYQIGFDLFPWISDSTTC